ncbi:MAG: hypothetical protein A2W28_11755, partial [Gammaproteobacteria bacterium RBG_16_51_14]
AVIDRPFDIQEGPFVLVKEFRLLNAQDIPAFEIQIAEIQRDILDKFIQEQGPGGFTIGQLQQISDEVTKYYREKGLILAQAVLPVQNVQNGIVDMQVFEGILGRVLAEGNNQYPAEILETPFKKLIGQPITKKEVEAALLTLTDYPGLSVFGVFQPGQHVGTADIVLKVQEEKRFDVAFRVDNEGTQETGRNRFRTTIDWNSPTGAADRVSLTAQQTYNPKNSTYYSFDYERFLGYGYKGGGFWNGNGFDVGGEFASSQIHAKTENIGVFLERSWFRSRLLNLSSRLSMTHKRSDTLTQGTQTNQDRLTVAGLELNFDSVDSVNPVRPFDTEDPDYGLGGGINFATLGVFHGFNDFLGAMGSPASASLKDPFFQPSRKGGSGEFAEGKFTKVGGGLTRLQLLTKHQSIMLRTEFQWTREILLPLEQYSIGGPDNVRAFPEAQALYDRAYFASLEYIHNAPGFADQPAFANRTWGELLQFSMFYDIAWGRNNDRLPGTPELPRGWQNFKGAGIGLRFNLPGTLESRMFWANEIGGETVAND